MSTSAEKLRSPLGIFIIYILVSAVLIMIFRFILPGAESPLLIYSRSWRLIQGLLTFFNLFPALALSSLVIPFGLVSFYEESYQSFSDMFFKRLVLSVITAIIAAVIYSAIFFLFLPIAKNYENNLRFSGELYQLAKKKAQEYSDAGEWYEASQFIKICERIWYNNKTEEFTDLKDRIGINLAEYVSEESEERSQARSALARDWRSVDLSALSEDEPLLDATEALSLSAEAFDEQRYFDAHWLASLGERLAVRGSAQAAMAARAASEAWNMIASQAPNQREERLYQLYELKLAGYQAMEAGDCIRAFYIFQELLEYTPDDPDAKKFFAVSERGAKQYAFFVDEMELSLGEILNGAVFSLPGGNGRTAIRFSTLTTLADVAYGIGFEYMDFDENFRPRSSAAARYVKLLPFAVDEKHQILILTHSLDRTNRNNESRGEWLLGKEQTGGILLDISFEDFLLISKVRQGLSNLQVDELYSASKKLENSGYVYQIFQAEILNKLGAALFFLPMAVFIIIIAWRYRARQRPRYLFVLLLPVFPVVFSVIVFLYRSIFNMLGIWLLLSIGFTSAVGVYIAVLGVSLFVSLIALAAQHS